MAEENVVEMIDSGFEDMEIDDLSEKQYNNLVFVDVQGFKGPHKQFLCKEFCLIDDNFIYHTFVKSEFNFNELPPYYQRQTKWLTNRYHGIKFETGDTSMDDLKKHIFPRLQNKLILVKGLQKVSWLEKMFDDFGTIECVNVEDLEEFDLNLRNSRPYEVCDYHNKIFRWTVGPCAKSTALMLQDVAIKSSMISKN